ncbi:MAG: YdcF family protein [Fibrobacteres bacterium]|jgi:hypothetical protein|nr:YdcF family protein [Fibrobacterota bacterium]
MPGPPFAISLLRRREMILPTWRGWLVLAILLAAGTRAFLAWVHPFLAVTQPVGGEVLAVEGWIPDYALKQALDEFRARHYSRLITTGGPVPVGMAFSYQGNYARLAAATLQSFGLSRDSIVVIPSPQVRKDRTFAEGVAVAGWMKKAGCDCRSLDLFSFSTHARRSRLLYRLALGKGVRVGVFAPRDVDYDPDRWWTSSDGVRRVTDEWLAYLYAALIFRE